MKRIALTILGVLILLIISTYIFVPAQLVINRQVKIYTPEQAIFKYLLHPKTWTGWWPEAQQEFVTRKTTLSGVDGTLILDKDSIRSQITYDVQEVSTMHITWAAVLETGVNPITRVNRYLKAQHIADSIDHILESAKNFLEDDRKVYGIHVEKVQILDSLVLTTKVIKDHQLSTDEIYQLVNSLKAYAAKSRAEVIGNPIMNRTKMAENSYQTMVAVPVNKWLPATSDIFTKKMVAHGNLLAANVTGGPNTVRQALEQLTNYMKDNRYIPPAIPYVELVTDRSKQPDSTKWITRINYPVL
ncbi:hypothetical protein MUY27_03360 [Mucilaginibacter sp. RS28]|uniref:Uncharacterized protein n=1 Tax=Mucilaginibacter straminoryzae TaxID=2932774 RepID=A0A9X1X1R7_9SPHI|nr:hypothetical protein [Mucilaginibacter straminoryzae]MCJ8208730.1 hypothetical protein [Mucilaginibacter straminoryzae]